MKGFLFFVFLFFINGAAFGLINKNPFLIEKKLSNKVIDEISKTLNPQVKKYKNRPVVKSLSKKITKKKYCYKIDGVEKGIVFSPFKIFNPQEINKFFYLPVNPSKSNFQIGLPINDFTLNFYSSSGQRKNNCWSYEIPFTKIEKNLNENLSLIVQKDNQIKEVSIDAPFSKSLQVQDLIYFYNVAPGNITLSLKTKNKKHVSSLIHIVEGQATFLDSRLEISENKKISLFTKKLMASKDSLIESSSFSFKHFLAKGSIKTKGFKLHLQEKANMRGFSPLIAASGSDDFFIHLTEDSNQVVMLDKDFRNYFFQINDLGNRDEFCFIQMKLTEKPIGGVFMLSNGHKAEDVDSFYLNRDGSISSSSREDSYHLILTGYDQGAINLKLIYEKESVIKQTYCAPGTYVSLN